MSAGYDVIYKVVPIMLMFLHCVQTNWSSLTLGIQTIHICSYWLHYLMQEQIDAVFLLGLIICICIYSVRSPTEMVSTNGRSRLDKKHTFHTLFNTQPSAKKHTSHHNYMPKWLKHTSIPLL